jgi:dihydroorotate dehydrogenase
MITLRNGHTFEYMTASGAMGFEGRGWPWEAPFRWVGLLDPTQFTVVLKTITKSRLIGNGMRSVRLIKGGTVNAVGLTNPGFWGWLEDHSSYVDRNTNPLISLLGTPTEIEEMLSEDIFLNMLEDGRLTGIELNGSCPNFCHVNDDAIIEECKIINKIVPNVPLILKIGAGQDYLRIVTKAKNYIDAVSVNSVPWKIVFPDKKSPLDHLGGGGVSGYAAQKVNWQILKDLVGLNTVPVIGCDVWNGLQDLYALRRIGVGAISFGAVFIIYPWYPNSLLIQDKKNSNNV